MGLVCREKCRYLKFVPQHFWMRNDANKNSTVSVGRLGNQIEFDLN